MKSSTKAGAILAGGLMLALALNLFLWVPGAKAAGPMENVKGLICEVQNILQTKSEKCQRLELIEKLTAKHLDFQEMAKRCLGSTWDTLNAGQKTEFVGLFSKLLKASYANHLDDFVKAKVNYQRETCDAEKAEVRISIIRPNDKIPVNFCLLQKPEGWKIYDLNIEGVSMVSNYRSQFKRAINAISYKGLVGRMKAHLKAENLG